MGKSGKNQKDGKPTPGKLSQWAKIKIVCKVVRGKLQKAYTMGYLTVPGQESGRALARLSTSCPSLNVEGEEIEYDDFFHPCKSSRSSDGAITTSRRGSGRSLRSEDGGYNTPSPTTPLTSGSLDDHHLCPDTPKIRVNDSTPTGSVEFLLDARKPLSVNSEAHRRRSWSGLSDEEKKRARQRSVSLSSLDSDTEEPFYDQEDGSKPGSDSLDSAQRKSHKHRSLSGSTSPVTYAGKNAGGSSSTYSLNDGHYEENTTKPTTEKPRLLAPRLTLQKSISTPSILVGVNAQQAQPEDSKLSYPYDDEASSSKRRKRGSIFFRKKKDKHKKSSHQFVGVCYGNSATCDVCSKPMANKPALRCETCLVCVHENTCKDQISDCSKFKNKITHKPILGLSSSVLNSTTKSSSLGSAPGSKSDSRPSSRSGRPRSGGHSSSPTRPHSFTAPSGGVSSPVRRISSFSQWRRVATKLGVNKLSDDRDIDYQPEPNEGNITEVNSASMESLEDGADTSESTLDSIDTDPDLRLLDTEPELWVNTVSKEFLSTLNEKEIKKQEHIYELIITEKHHCIMLKVLKELFAAGMLKELGMKDTQVNSIFPCIDQLITIHFSFLWRLRERQRTSQYIEAIGDLLLQQFVGDNAQGLKEAYGGFCSQHQDAVANYKELLKTDRRFQSFIRSRANHHLLKKKGIPEVILFVTHRVTKYPLMIEALLKYSKSQPDEMSNLKKALDSVKEILMNINSQVAEKEKRQRLLDMYHKIDAKSSIMYNDQKFKKSDILTGGRKLMFEGQAALSQQRGKQLNVVMIVMSDIIFFLQENNQKYYFVSPDSKAGALSLCKLLVREKAGQDSKVIYLISKNQAEMFELTCVHPKDKKVWIDSIRDAVNHCPSNDLSELGFRLTAGNTDKIHEILSMMQQQDRDIAKLCEEKVRNFFHICSAFGSEVDLTPPNYIALLDSRNLDPDAAKEMQMSSIIESLRLVTGSTSWGTNLARSVSSVGEHQSDAYVSPSLPKRAETFGGFDNPNGTLPQTKQSAAKKKKDSKTSLYSDAGNEVIEELKNKPVTPALSVLSSQDNMSESSLSTETSQLQQSNLTSQLVQHLSTVLVLSHHHLTQYEMLRAKVSSGVVFDGKFSHSHKLEELRNIQEQISHERAQWMRDRDAQEKWLANKGEDLKRTQESLKCQQDDINQQREDLYRKLEALKSQGIILNPTLTVLPSSTPSYQSTSHGSFSSAEACISGGSSHVSPTAGISHQRQKQDYKHKPPTIPPPVAKRDSSTIITSSSQQKLIKQQFPLKLAKMGTAGSSSGSSSGSYSSMSSSLGGSPSQDQSSKDFGTKVGLPYKPCESIGESRIKPTGTYQRLSSPSALPDCSSDKKAGSSTDLQNGPPSPTANSSTKSGDDVCERVSVTDCSSKSQPNPTSVIKPANFDPSRRVSKPDSTAKSGQRVKDPDTDQDIIFF